MDTSTTKLKEGASLQQRWQPIARRAMFVVLLLLLGIFIVYIALFPTYITQHQPSLAPNEHWTNETALAALDQLGWSPIGFAWFHEALSWVSGLIFICVGLLIFFRKADDWFRLYLSLTFVLMGATTGSTPAVLDQIGPVLTSAFNFLGIIGWQLMFILFLLFPDGRFVPRWTRWLLLGWLGVNIISLFTSAAPVQFLSLVVFVALVLCTIGSQVYRYRKHSDMTQRQQTKWLVYALMVFALYIPLGLLPNLLIEPFSQNGAASFLSTIAILTLFIGVISLIPISIGIAILRYRLWDIDIIIRRTLIYVPLTAILAGVFSVTITLSQKLFVAFTGTQSEAATALATLLVVAVFDPIKRSIQSVVDRRFKEVPDPVKELKAYGDQVKAVLNVVRVEQSTSNLLDRALAAYHAKNGAVYLERNGEMKLAQTRGEWSDDPKLTVSLGDAEQDGSIGKLSLGPRLNGSDYSKEDRQTLQTVSNLVALAIRTAERTK